MILTDDDIKAAIKSGDISIDPFDESQIQPASIDLRVGDEGATTKHKRKTNIRDQGLIVLEPGDFGVISILEKVKFGPQYVGRLGLRSKFARKGLIATTGPQIDPGFEGSITLGLANLTPKSVPLSHSDDILTLEIHRLQKPAAHPYCGPYQGKYGLSTEDLDSIAEGDGMAFSEVLTTLRSLSSNVGDLSEKMTDLAGQMKTQQWMVPLIVTIALGVIAIIVALK
ncbi:dCTP deaminase [Sphingomonas segetis]|jgi:dCTP deaminase|uniref:dCTP deaminase n=1 Tax=Sphingomonas segetis TaxID=1104779 RepID=UPI0018AD4193|nr:dCTP deaminase [Sphingomonas segetis]